MSQVSRTLLSILVDLNNAVVWMVSTCPLVSKSFGLFTDPLEIVLYTIGITVTFMFHRCFYSFSFFCSLARSIYLPLFLISFNFTLWSARTAKSTIRQVLFICELSLGLVICQRFGDSFVSENPWELCAFHSPGMDIELYIHLLFIWSNFNFLYDSMWSNFPIQSYQDKYCAWASLNESVFCLPWKLACEIFSFYFNLSFTLNWHVCKT